MTSRTARQGHDQGQAEAWLRQIDADLRPILGIRTRPVVRRLGTLALYQEQLELWATVPKERRRRQQRQAESVLNAWQELRKAIQSSDATLVEVLWASGEGLPPLEEIARCFEPLCLLTGPIRTGRPQNAKRALILDDLIFALHAAGVRLFKTDCGVVEQAAVVVLNALGDDVKDPGRDVAKAIDRFFEVQKHIG